MEASHRTFEEGRRAGRREATGRSISQTFCLIVGGGLIAAGVLGFIFGGSGFGAGSDIEGEEFLFLEVNGWHNIVHIATGAFLLLMMPTARSASLGALIFGAVYVPVTIWGFAAGDSIANVVAINPADNWLHVALAVAGIVVGATGGALAESGRREADRAEEERPRRGESVEAVREQREGVRRS